MKQAAQSGILLFVHGYNTKFVHAAEAQVSIRRKLQAHGWGGAVIGVDWPSYGGWFGSLSYWDDSENARLSAPVLVRLFCSVLCRCDIEMFSR